MYTKGFTLAETLITLGIVSIVAALTIPNLMTAYKARRYRTQFLKSYSTLQQIFKQMQNDDISLDGSNYGGAQFRKVIKPYLLNNTTQCYTAEELKSPLCLSKNKEQYNNLPNTTKMNWEGFDDGQFILADGSQLFIENPTSNYNRVIFHIDLNGYKTPPNRAGIDLFSFQMMDNEILPMGAPGTTNAGPYFCNKDVTGFASGTSCAVKAKDDPDYFKQALKIK
ncbi:MAG: type II secretion system GspH family protein [Muribaculaceae bacterium]|nr:type II secretion system GspH family protein [Muribaculaceae bacterium]